MANLTITVANTLSLGGGGPPTLYGVGIYGTDRYLSGSVDFIEAVTKLVEDGLSLASAISQVTLDFYIAAGSITLTSEAVAEYKTSGIWSYLFPGDVTNAEDRISTSYSEPTAAASSFTASAAASTVWS